MKHFRKRLLPLLLVLAMLLPQTMPTASATQYLRLLPNDPDYSEMNLAIQSSYLADNPISNQVDTGGCSDLATAYFARWDGPIPESSQPYRYYSHLPVHESPAVHIREAIEVTGKNTAENPYAYVEALKQAVLEYGAADFSFSTPESNMYYNTAPDGSYNLYIPPDYTEYSGGHAVELIGWDDNYPRTYFSEQPPIDGAFLLKNSWGDSWGNGGFFYMSYASSTNSSSITIFKPCEGSDPSNTIYQYDPYGPTIFSTEAIGNLAHLRYAANLFPQKGETLTQDETLHSFSLYTNSDGVQYTAYIVPDVQNETEMNRRILLENCTVVRGEIERAGYHVIDLQTPVALHAGKRFGIAIHLSDNAYACELPMFDYCEYARAKKGESFFSLGLLAHDLTNVLMNANWCIKAFTSRDAQIHASGESAQYEGAAKATREYASDRIYNADQMQAMGFEIDPEFLEYTRSADKTDALRPSPIVYAESSTPAKPLPAAFDWRDYGCVTNVKNQGNLGLCWAFASMASLESNVLLSNLPDRQPAPWHEVTEIPVSEAGMDLTFAAGEERFFSITAPTYNNYILQMDATAPFILQYLYQHSNSDPFTAEAQHIFHDYLRADETVWIRIKAKEDMRIHLCFSTALELCNRNAAELAVGGTASGSVVYENPDAYRVQVEGNTNNLLTLHGDVHSLNAECVLVYNNGLAPDRYDLSWYSGKDGSVTTSFQIEEDVPDYVLLLIYSMEGKADYSLQLHSEPLPRLDISKLDIDAAVALERGERLTDALQSGEERVYRLEFDPDFFEDEDFTYGFFRLNLQTDAPVYWYVSRGPVEGLVTMNCMDKTDGLLREELFLPDPESPIYLVLRAGADPAQCTIQYWSNTAEYLIRTFTETAQEIRLGEEKSFVNKTDEDMYCLLRFTPSTDGLYMLDTVDHEAGGYFEFVLTEAGKPVAQPSTDENTMRVNGYSLRAGETYYFVYTLRQYDTEPVSLLIRKLYSSDLTAVIPVDNHTSAYLENLDDEAVFEYTAPQTDLYALNIVYDLGGLFQCQLEYPERENQDEILYFPRASAQLPLRAGETVRLHFRFFLEDELYNPYSYSTIRITPRIHVDTTHSLRNAQPLVFDEDSALFCTPNANGISVFQTQTDGIGSLVSDSQGDSFMLLDSSMKKIPCMRMLNNNSSDKFYFSYRKGETYYLLMDYSSCRVKLNDQPHTHYLYVRESMTIEDWSANSDWDPIVSLRSEDTSVAVINDDNSVCGVGCGSTWIIATRESGTKECLRVHVSMSLWQWIIRYLFFGWLFRYPF